MWVRAGECREEEGLVCVDELVHRLQHRRHDFLLLSVFGGQRLHKLEIVDATVPVCVDGQTHLLHLSLCEGVARDRGHSLVELMVLQIAVSVKVVASEYGEEVAVGVVGHDGAQPSNEVARALRETTSELGGGEAVELEDELLHWDAGVAVGEERGDDVVHLVGGQPVAAVRDGAVQQLSRLLDCDDAVSVGVHGVEDGLYAHVRHHQRCP
mmetsp:Transcript_33715/g.72723  ORF Transcript_33715/g.72723 Transcript_33715/m.72723 type:complete len:211 (-) Transcript_33715:695-1327(-)